MNLYRPRHILVTGGAGFIGCHVVHRLCAAVADLTGAPLPQFTRLIRFVPERPRHDWRYDLDAAKIQHEPGWAPGETFATGLRKTAAWYIQHGSFRHG